VNCKPLVAYILLTRAIQWLTNSRERGHCTGAFACWVSAFSPLINRCNCTTDVQQLHACVLKRYVITFLLLTQLVLHARERDATKVGGALDLERWTARPRQQPR